MEIYKDFSFDSAHFLPNVPAGHKCGRLHGHTFQLRIVVTGPVGETTGWILVILNRFLNPFMTS